MNAAEIREMSVEDIQTELDDARESLMRLRFQLTTGELTDHTQIRFTRRNIARLVTILKERAEEKEGE
ncbi:MAG TPA: 50S ribosomal protein L29 [Anaerolineales bacterium]|nr:50S ribosomal protein L29 [Anaerolineales bacterium]